MWILEPHFLYAFKNNGCEILVACPLKISYLLKKEENVTKSKNMYGAKIQEWLRKMPTHSSLIQDAVLHSGCAEKMCKIRAVTVGVML